jgi:tRNA(Ile)-lysidine synthase
MDPATQPRPRPLTASGPSPPVDASLLVHAAAPLLDRCRFPAAGSTVTCGVSGGADSSALLALAVAAGLQVTAVHVDHGLRPGSAREAEVVATTAAALGAAFRSVTVRVEAGPNLEARARAARRGALPVAALLGHTADDQAETMLLNLMRGAGLEGLAGMRVDGRRPILALRRHETVALCAALDLDLVADPSNHDPAFRRNRVRHEMLPLLAEIAGRDVVPVLARQATLTRDAVDHLVSDAERLDPTDASALAGAPVVLARLAVRRWLRTCSDERHPPDAATVERVLEVARIERRATDVGGGWRVARTDGRLRLESGAPGRDGRGAPSVG